MTSMQNAAVKAGLVSESDVRRIEIEKEKMERKRVESKKRRRVVENLSKLDKMSEFCVAVRVELEYDPKLIWSAIKLAHRFKDENGGKKLIWTLYQIRNQFPTISTRETRVFLKKWLESFC